MFVLTAVFSWQNSVSLCPASFCTPRANLPDTPGISWFPVFAFESPVMKRTSFFGVSSRKSWRSSQNHSTSASSGSVFGNRLGLLWCWIICLEMNWDHSIGFKIAPKYCFWTLVDYEAYSISSKRFLPTVVDVWSSELNSLIPVHLNSLLPKMSVFTLAISCLITSNFPWFKDLASQVPMQHCYLQYWTLLLPPEQMHRWASFLL